MTYPAASVSADTGMDSRVVRQTLMLALAEVAAEDGLAASTPQRIAARAGLPVSAFEEQFVSVDECMLALYDATVAATLAAVNDAVKPCNVTRGGDAWRTQLDAGFSAALQSLAALPAVAVTCFREAPALGAPTLERRAAALDQFVAYAERLRQTEAASLPPLAVEMLVRGTFELIQARAAAGLAGELPELLNELRGLWLGAYGSPSL